MNIINEEEENLSKINTIITKSNKLKLYCITWNMYELNPNQNEIQSLLDPHKNCDIYVFHKKFNPPFPLLPQDKKFHKILYPPFKKIIKKYISRIIKIRKS
jgi:hypothetical protein